MTLPGVNISASVSGTPSFPDRDGVALFVGVAATNRDTVTPVGKETDIAETFGAGTLSTVLTQAQRNGSPNWKAFALGYENSGDWITKISPAAQSATINGVLEFLVVCDAMTASTDVAALQTIVSGLEANAIFAFALCSGPSIADNVSWAAYLTALAAPIASATAASVSMVAPIWGTELGSFAGRYEEVTYGATGNVRVPPYRQVDGAVASPGDYPQSTEATPEELPQSTLTATETLGLATYNRYPGLAGVFFGPGNLLSATGATLTQVDQLRVLNKAKARVRLALLPALGSSQMAANNEQGRAAMRQLRALCPQHHGCRRRDIPHRRGA